MPSGGRIKAYRFDVFSSRFLILRFKLQRSIEYKEKKKELSQRLSLHLKEREILLRLASVRYARTWDRYDDAISARLCLNNEGSAGLMSVV